MAVHLITVAGGYVDVLPHMLRHYRSLGIDSIFVNLHLTNEDDPARDQVRRITREDGCGIASVTVGDWQTVEHELYLRQRERYPSDWFVLADQDELQRWPGKISELLGDRWDFVRGCYVDRIARDGGFPEVRDESIWDQFPLGCVMTGAVLSGDPRKVVAAKGAVPLARGQHHALSGEPCPGEELYIPVHHFKWTAGLAERLERRASAFRRTGLPIWGESARFVDYYRAQGGQIDLTDPRLMVARCDPEYPHWEGLKQFMLRAPVEIQA